MKQYLTIIFSIVLAMVFAGCDSSTDGNIPSVETTTKTTTSTTLTTTTTTTVATTTTMSTTHPNEVIQLLPTWRTSHLKAVTCVVKDPHNSGKWLYGVTGVQVCHTYDDTCIIESKGFYGGHNTIVTVGFTDYDYYGEDSANGIEHVGPSRYDELIVYIDSFASDMVTNGYYTPEATIEIYDDTQTLVLRDYGDYAGLAVKPDMAYIVWENVSGSHEYYLPEGYTLMLSDPGYGVELHYPQIDAAIEAGRQNNWGLG